MKVLLEREKSGHPCGLQLRGLLLENERYVGSYTAAHSLERRHRKKAIPSAYPKVRASVWSEHAEALAALTDGQLQQFVQLLVGVVGREAQLVKTREVPRNKFTNKGKPIRSYIIL